MTEALVSTQWVADNLEKIRLIEVDVDTSQHEAGRIPGAVHLEWTRTLKGGGNVRVACTSLATTRKPQPSFNDAWRPTSSP